MRYLDFDFHNIWALTAVGWGYLGVCSLPQLKRNKVLKEGNIPNINRKKTIFLKISSCMFEYRENKSNLKMKEMYEILIPRN